MGSDIFSDAILNVTFWLGMALFLLTFVLFGLIVVLRFSLIHKNRHKQKVIEKWLPLLQQAEAQVLPDTIPFLNPADLLLFLSLWINLYELADEGGREALVMVALQAGAEPCIQPLLLKGNARSKMMALTLAGAIRDSKYLPVFTTLLHDANASVSLASARALLLTFPQEAMPLLSQSLIHRQDWPLARASMVFLEGGMDVLSQALISAVAVAGSQDLPRLISFFHIIPAHQALPTLQEIAARYPAEEAIVLAILRAMGHYSYTENLPSIRAHLENSHPMVRAEAATLLGKFGTSQDGEVLLKALEDPSELVRYRVAQAMLNLSSSDTKNAENTSPFTLLQQKLQNVDSKDILMRVFIERDHQK